VNIIFKSRDTQLIKKSWHSNNCRTKVTSIVIFLSQLTSIRIGKHLNQKMHHSMANCTLQVAQELKLADNDRTTKIILQLPPMLYITTKRCLHYAFFLIIQYDQMINNELMFDLQLNLKLTNDQFDRVPRVCLLRRIAKTSQMKNYKITF